MTALHVLKLRLFQVLLVFWCRMHGKWDVRVPEGSALSAAQLSEVFRSAKSALPWRWRSL